MIEYHKFGLGDSNGGRIKCHGPELQNPHGNHTCMHKNLFSIALVFLQPCASLVGASFSPVVSLWVLPGADVALNLG